MRWRYGAVWGLRMDEWMEKKQALERELVSVMKEHDVALEECGVRIDVDYRFGTKIFIDITGYL